MNLQIFAKIKMGKVMIVGEKKIKKIMIITSKSWRCPLIGFNMYLQTHRNTDPHALNAFIYL